MTIIDSAKLVRKYFILLITLPLLLSISTAYISINYIKPTYSSYTTLYVLNKQSQENISYNDLTTSGLLIKDYRELVLSRRVTKKVADEFGLENLNEFTIDVTTVNDTRLIKIVVSGHDPIQITAIANSLSREFSLSITEIMQVENVSIVDEALVPSLPSGPDVVKITSLAFLLGLFVAAIISLFSEMLNTTIKSAEEIEELFSVSVLAQIPKNENLKDNNVKLHR